MKRGLLLKAGAKKVAAKRRSDAQKGESSKVAEDSQHPKESDTDEGTEERKTLPSGYDLSSGKFLYNLKNSDPRITGFSKDLIIITTVPQSVPAGETKCAWIVNASTKPKVLNSTGYPSRIPKTRPDLYEIRPTPGMGKGVFAKRDIKRGEIIFAERPLLVTPELKLVPQNVAQLGQNFSEFETFLEAAIARLPPKSQADFRALENAYTSEQCGPLLGIARTNNHELRNLFDGSDLSENYKTVNKIASRINHSCVPNVKYYFKVNSFSMQWFALRDIKAGDQLFHSYPLVTRNLAERQADLLPYGFTCNCPSCLNATTETDELRTTFGTLIAYFKETLINRPKIDESGLEAALEFEKKVLKEGLDAHDEYLVLLMAISAGYAKLGKGEESRKYRTLMETFQKFMQDEWRGIPILQM